MASVVVKIFSLLLWRLPDVVADIGVTSGFKLLLDVLSFSSENLTFEAAMVRFMSKRQLEFDVLVEKETKNVWLTCGSSC